VGAQGRVVQLVLESAALGDHPLGGLRLAQVRGDERAAPQRLGAGRGALVLREGYRWLTRALAADGMPLAIELAAVWIRTLSVGQIEARLDNCFQLLTRGSRGAPTRQQTLAAAIDWSHALCSPRGAGAVSAVVGLPGLAGFSSNA
jgi:hypothetical protein